MSRLLLVDDNPSIHKIAETLLVGTGIELICSESATQALDLIRQGERFDVALLDTAMVGMDGWALLDEMRKIPSTAGIPIAMMAGVLDTVDPARIQGAPIQGFLKKPVELRDLADRIQKLLETPVEPVSAPAPVPAASDKPKLSPFETMPATRLKDLPELRHLSQEVLPEPPSSPASAPESGLDLEMESLDDLLELTDEDLLQEERAAVGEPALAALPVAAGASVGEPASEILDEITEEALDLEELDLDSLRELPAPEVQVSSLPTPPIQVPPPTERVPDLTPPEGFIASAMDEAPAPSAADSFDLPDLGPIEDNPFDMEISEAAERAGASLSLEAEPVFEAAPHLPEDRPSQPLPELPPMDDFAFDMTEDSDSLLASLEPLSAASAPAAPQAGFEADPELDLEAERGTDPGLDLGAGAPGTATEILQFELEEPAAPESAEEGLEYLEETLSGIGAEMPAITTRTPVVPEPEEATSPGTSVVDSDDELLAEDEVTGAPAAVSALDAAPAAVMAAIPVPGSSPSAITEAPAVQASAATGSHRDLLDAILADPEMMEILTKAVVARMGDQALREIAWELMPELAERLSNR